MKHLKTKPVAIALAVLLIVAAGVFALMSGAKRKAAEKDAPPTPALTVTVAKPQSISLPLRLTANGDITAWQEAIVGSESSGLQLDEVRVNVGDSVRAGQVLAVFAAESTQADVAQARAALLEAEATAADAAGNAARARTLEATGALSAQQINQYMTAEQTAAARVAAARATLNAQQVRLRHTQVLAPDHGVISSRTATVGAVVNAGTELFRLIRKGRLEWRAEVTSTELGRIAPGTAATVTAANGTELTGRVRMIAPTVDPQSRAALVYVDLAPTAAALAPARAGMFGKGAFELGVSNALTVPQQTVVVRDGFNYVFRVNPDNRVTQVRVKIGRRLAERVEVVDGVAADSTLAVSGAGFLNDGDLVRVVADAAPGKTPAPAPVTAPVPAVTR